MTTEHVVVLFTDVVGSTELAMAHTPDGADDVRRAHFAVLRQAIAGAGGTEVKNLGDGLMVVFGSASAAVACAVAMQQGVERESRNRELRVGLRVGLSGGETTHEDDDYFGDPVVEAARLCAACESGQILAADVVRLMAGRRNRHECRSVGTLELKGLPDPVESVEVIWEILEATKAATRIPLPSRLAVRPDIGIVGRKVELDALDEAAKRTGHGEPREFFLISGEAGLGKTTLVAEIARRAYENGACVLFGHCEEDLATPYQLFAEALGHYITHASEDRLLAHVAAHGSELSRVVTNMASRIPQLPPTKATDADSERFLLFSSMVGLLADAAAEQPIVLVVDDLQWADKASLLFLRHLAATTQPMRLLVLGTFRDSELSNTHPLLEALATLHRQAGVTRLELAGMDQSEVVAFMEAAAGYSLDETEIGLADAVHRETEGNPFFVTEVLRHLSESGAISRDAEGRWRAVGPIEDMILPDSLREVIGARLGRLGEETGRVLTMAAAIGRDFDLDLLALSIERSEDEVLDFLDLAATASIVRELTDGPGHYNFSHALIQHALYQDLGPTRQARAHRAIALALEVLCGDRPGSRIGELARHWGSTGRAGDAMKAITYARGAGDAALRTLSPGDALRYYTQALDLTEGAGLAEPTLEIDLTIGMGMAQRQTGDPAFRETLLDATRRAAAIDDTDRLVTGALANDRGWASASGKVDTEKVALLELARDRLSADDPRRALILGTLCAELAFSGTVEERQGLADEALAIAEAYGDDATVIRILNHLVFPLLVPALLDQSLAWSADALVRAERVGDPVLLYFAAIYRATVATRAGDVDEVDRCLGIAEPLVRMLDQPPMSWEFTFHQAKRAQIAGDTATAEALAAAAFQIGVDCGQPDAETFFGVQLAAVSWQRGTMGDLAPLLEAMIVESPGLPTLKASLALAYTQADRLDEARVLLDAFAATGFDLPQDSAWLNGMTEYAEAAIACRDRRFAEPLFDMLKPWSAQFSSAGGVTAEGPVATMLGGLAAVLGRWDDAEAYFAGAKGFCSRVGAVYFGAHVDLLWGQKLLDQGRHEDVGRARDLLTAAQSTATAQGYGLIEARAASALAGSA